MIPTDATALWKQMKSMSYNPISAEAEKGASTSTWPQGLGPVAEGALITGFWSRSLGYPGTNDLIAKSDKAGITNSNEQSGFVAGDSITLGLLDAIVRANSPYPHKLNTATWQTDKNYTAGPLKFG